MRAHAAGVRAGLAVERLLVILGRRERDELLPVGQRHERDFLAGQELLDQDAVRGVAELLLLEDQPQILLGLRLRFDDDDAFARRQAVDFDDGRIAELFQRRLAPRPSTRRRAPRRWGCRTCA